jgi:hypothetical protein
VGLCISGRTKIRMEKDKNNKIVAMSSGLFVVVDDVMFHLTLLMCFFPTSVPMLGILFKCRFAEWMWSTNQILPTIKALTIYNV